MAVQTRSVLKTYFETGDKPTAAQFGDLIDSVFAANHVINHSVSTITAVSGTVYSTAITSTLTVDCNALESGESFVVNRGITTAAANALTQFRHSNLICYADGYNIILTYMNQVTA